MISKTPQEDRPPQYYGTNISPYSPAAYEIRVTKDGRIVVTLLWIPPEDASQLHILTRIALPKSMAKNMSDDLMKAVKDLETKSQETVSHRKKEAEERIEKKWA